MITAIATLDSVLDAHAVALGSDLAAYRNHTYRLVNLCVAFSPSGDEQLEKIAVAAAFHDLGIWTERTFDYLLPSVTLAAAHLASVGKAAWTPEVSAMILQHHKLSPYRFDRHWLVEPFRRADWVDVSRGLVTFGLPRSFVKEIQTVWPSAGFHTRLVRLELERLWTHPWNPLPMVRL